MGKGDKEQADDHQTLMPHSFSAEQSVLGVMLMDGVSQNGWDVLDQVDDKMFFNKFHQSLFATIVEFYSRNLVPDPISLAEELEPIVAIDKGEVISRLALMIEKAEPTGAFQHCQIIRDKYFKRRMITLANEKISEASGDKRPVEEIVAELMSDVTALAASTAREEGLQLSDFSVRKKEYDDLEFTLGLTTGFDYLDEKTNGYHPGDVIVIMGRPETYKTWLAIYKAYKMWLAGYDVLFVSLEMNKKKVAYRFDSFIAKVESKKIKSKGLDADEYQSFCNIQDAVERRKNKITILDRKDMLVATPQMIRAKAQKYKPHVVIVDSLTATDSPQKGKDIRHDVVFTMREFKQVAEIEGIPFILIHHTTKGKDKFGTITKDASSESDEVAKVADVIYHLQITDEMDDQNLLYLGMAKCRDGEKEHVTLNCDMSIPTFGIEKEGLIKAPIEMPDFL